MKTIISVLIVIFGATGFLITREMNVHRSCSCSGTFCSCSVSCLDFGEIPNCACGTFSCICKCDPKDVDNSNNFLVPTMTADQETNSNKGEGYFRNLGGIDAVTIANGIKGLRDAIKSGDSNKYQSNATLVETTFARLPDAQKNAWEIWSNQNLKK